VAPDDPITLTQTELPSFVREYGAATVIGPVETDILYVASSRGKYYYPSNCSYAKQLSPANLLNFFSEEEAEKAGYQKSTRC